MAYERPLRVTGAIRGVSTDIPTVAGFSITTRAMMIEGLNDASIGNVVVEAAGIEVTGVLRLQSYDEARNLRNAAVAALKLDYYTNVTGTKTSRRRTLDNVRFGNHDPIEIKVPDPTGGSNPPPEWGMSFRGVFSAADDGVEDFMAVGAGP